MADESDGVEEAFEGQLRVLLTTAAQTAERFTMARERALERARRESEREAAELRTRFEAERLAARAELASIHRPEWWDRATPQQIGDTYQLANAWAREDGDAQRAKDTLSAELRNRYGIDTATLDRDAAALRAAVEEAEQQRVASDAERRRAQQDSAEAVSLTQEADAAEADAAEARAAAEFEPDPFERADAERMAKSHEDRAAQLREEAVPAYDSAERREATARELEANGLSRDAVATKMRADVSQAAPATEATRTGGARSPKARSSRGQGTGRQHTGLNR